MGAPDALVRGRVLEGSAGGGEVLPEPRGLSSLGEVNEAAFEADGDGFGTVGGVELLEDVQHVDLDDGLGPCRGRFG